MIGNVDRIEKPEISVKQYFLGEGKGRRGP